MTWYRRLLRVLIPLLALSGCGGPERDSAAGQGPSPAATATPEKPRYPEIPFPPSAQAVGAEEIEGVRVIWFDTPDPPARVYAFYAERLRASGWITGTGPPNDRDTRFFEYHNGPGNPAFQLSVAAPPAESAVTGVTLNVDLIPAGLTDPLHGFDDNGTDQAWREAWPTVSIPSAMRATPTRPLELALPAAEQRWALQAPRNYTITTVATNSGFFDEDIPTECTTVLRVRDGAMDIRRYDPCPWWSATESTIPNLFILLSNPSYHLPPTTTPEACVRAAFDPVYGHPTSISLHCPGISDHGLDIAIRLMVE